MTPSNDGPPSFRARIHLMNRGGELQIQSSVVLRKHVLAVGFLAHLDIGDGIAASFDDTRFAPPHLRAWNTERATGIDRRQTARHAAGIKQIETDLVTAGLGHIGFGMPWVDRGADRRRLLAVGNMVQNVVKFAVSERVPA